MMDSGRATATHDWKVLILAAAALFTAWAFVVPVFEAPDEFLHWQYARYLHDHVRLPVYGQSFEEANSPPLYYALVAPVATRTRTPPPMIWTDGMRQIVLPFRPRLHMNAADDLRHYWPIRWARLITVLMSLVTVAACLRAGAVVAVGTGASVAATSLLAAGLVAFLPQFAFRGSHISNDVLLTTLSACTLWGLVTLLFRGFTWRVALLTAVAVAGAFLSKPNAVCLGPPLALVILMDGQAAWRVRVARVAAVTGVVLAIIAPWAIRNVILYGDPLASGAMYHVVPGLIKERSFWDVSLWTAMPRMLFKSFVGLFGYMEHALHKSGYAAYLIFLLAAGAGFLVRAVREARVARLAALLAVLLIGNYAFVVFINLRLDQPQGRYMFPALPAIMLAAAIGVQAWPRVAGRAALPVARAIVIIWAMVNAAILWWFVRPAYTPLVASVSRATIEVAPLRSAGEEDWTAPVRVPAPDARFAMFDFERKPGHPKIVSGTLTYTVEENGKRRDIPAPFQWLAIEPSHPVVVMMMDRVPPAGTVTHVRVHLLEDAEISGVRGMRLMGSLASWDY